MRWPSTGPTSSPSPVHRHKRAGQAPIPKPAGDTARHGPGQHHELFYGFYLGLATMVREEHGSAVPELVRRMGLSSCHVDPVPAFVPVLENMVASGVAPGDVLNDSGYSHRIAEHWALPLRALGAELVMDLHPHDRGRQGTHHGAICWNGSLYCPSTPAGLFALEPLARGANPEEMAAHDSAAPSWTVTASPSSTPTTRTDITASCAPPLRASSVVRAGPSQWPSPIAVPRSSPRPSMHRCAVSK